MIFNEIVIERILPILNRNSFKITQQFKNFLRFESESMVVILGHNEFDKTNLIEIGRKNEFIYPIYGKLLKQVFGFYLEVENATEAIYISNIANFLLDKGVKLIQGDQLSLDSVRSFVQKDSADNLAQLNNEMYFTDAETAWNNKNYKEFVKIVDHIDKKYLPKSYMLKYKIAVRNG